jgi:Flp pilus assembly protein TadD
MSLMNDALRKKKLEGDSEAGRRPYRPGARARRLLGVKTLKRAGLLLAGVLTCGAGYVFSLAPSAQELPVAHPRPAPAGMTTAAEPQAASPLGVGRNTADIAGQATPGGAAGPPATAIAPAPSPPGPVIAPASGAHPTDKIPPVKVGMVRPAVSDPAPTLPKARNTSAPTPVPAGTKVRRTSGKRAAGQPPPAPAPAENAAPRTSEDPFFEKGLAYHRMGRFKDAARMYREVLRKNPEHPDARFNLASACIQLSEFAEACPLLADLQARDPANPEVLLNLALAEVGMGRPWKALDYLSEAEALPNGSSFEICFHRGLALSQLDRLPEALTCYRKAEKLSPDHPRLIFNLAVVYDKLQKYPEALGYYARIVPGEDGLPPLEAQAVAARINTLKAYLGRQPG